MNSALTPLFSYAGNLLSARDYSTQMLRDKIKTKFPSSSQEEMDEVIETLSEKKYLDESRSIENFIRYRREYSPRGKRMISQD